MDCSPPGSSDSGDSPGKTTGVVCYALLQESSPLRDQTQVSHITGGFFTSDPPGMPWFLAWPAFYLLDISAFGEAGEGPLA